MLERFPAGLRHSLHVMPGHSRPKDGVASLADDPGIHEMTQQRQSYKLNFAAIWDCGDSALNGSASALNRSSER
jgi:hypothetical protein